MLPFFRRIRQSLLSDRNTGKYLKYAIGEILLVMVGILLALQVNNWNEARKKRILEKYYCERIIEDLEADLIEMDRVVNNAFGQIYTVVETLDSMGVDTKAYFKTLGNPQNFVKAAFDRLESDAERRQRRKSRSFGYKQGGLWGGQQVDFALSTYNELVNNGQLEVISLIELRKQIVDHYNVNLNLWRIQQYALDVRQDHRDFLLAQNIPIRHDMSYNEFMNKIQDKASYEVILKNYVWGISFGYNTYRTGSRERTQDMINAITAYLEEF